jgi:hypothetical protein
MNLLITIEGRLDNLDFLLKEKYLRVADTGVYFQVGFSELFVL